MQAPFIGPSYNLLDRQASVQRTVNMVPVPLEPGNERTGWEFEDVPGLELFGLSLCFFEDFSEGLTPYTTNGDTSIFGIEDGVLKVSPQNGGSAYIQRPLGIAGPVVTISGDVKVSALAIDDSCGFYVIDGSGLRFGFVPRAAAGNDSLRRAAIDYQTGGVYIGSGALEPDVWYRFRITLYPEPDQSTVEIHLLSDSSLFASTTIPGVHGPVAASNCRFFIDSSALTCATHYDNVSVCPHL